MVPGAPANGLRTSFFPSHSQCPKRHAHAVETNTVKRLFEKMPIRQYRK